MNICFFVDDDLCWNLNTIRKTIPILQRNGLRVKCIWILPNKLSNKYGFKITLWWLSTFGLINFIKLVLFYLLVRIKNKIINCENFNKLQTLTNVNVYNIKNPNEKSVISFIKKNKIKYSLSLTDHIFGSKILKIPNHNILNKHSSLLPSLKGLLPYFWAKIKKQNNGVSVHVVSNKVDSGKIVYQKKINKNFFSMVNFYIYIFKNYPYYILKAINNLKKKKFIKNNYESSYYSLPDIKDYKLFLKNGGKVISFSDVYNFKNLIE